MVHGVGWVVELTADEHAELRDLDNSPDVPATVGIRARIVLWRAEGRLKKEIADWAGVSRPTVDLWLTRYAADGVAGLMDHCRGAGRVQVPASTRPRVLALTHLAAGRVGPVALVVAGNGRVPRPHRGRVHLGPPRGETVARQRNPTPPAGHLQDQQGPGIHRESRRRRRALPRAARRLDATAAPCPG
ncbi:helix-turn-helix domain-containing protein [Amycolatopsis halotolerans]|uniref:Helix-turn-helix domain-containing protein n=1 Tax=Amycolatopsis halotolerans TaxID=330083 RepID=A0ABV7QKU7_9PSEU